MPRLPLKPCPAPACSALVEKGRCPKHQRPAWYRPIALTCSQRGYGSEWQKLRAQVIAEEPYCRLCGMPTTDVDHIVPKARGGATTRSNLQGLCGGCHRHKTASRDSKGEGGRKVWIGSIHGTAGLPPRAFSRNMRGGW